MHFFLPPTALFSILMDLHKREEFSIILVKYQTHDSAPVVRIHNLLSESPNLYSEKPYDEFLLSTSALPSSDTDTFFYSNNPQNVIRFEKGRLLGDELELCKMQTVAKHSSVKKLYAKLRRRIRRVCTEKEVVIGTTLYKSVFYSKSALAFKLLLITNPKTGQKHFAQSAHLG